MEEMAFQNGQSYRQAQMGFTLISDLGGRRTLSARAQERAQRGIFASPPKTRHSNEAVSFAMSSVLGSFLHQSQRMTCLLVCVLEVICVLLWVLDAL